MATSDLAMTRRQTRQGPQHRKAYALGGATAICLVAKSARFRVHFVSRSKTRAIAVLYGSRHLALSESARRPLAPGVAGADWIGYGLQSKCNAKKWNAELA
jgi:hypothetical protein